MEHILLWTSNKTLYIYHRFANIVSRDLDIHFQYQSVVNVFISETVRANTKMHDTTHILSISPSNDIVVNTLLHDLDLNFQRKKILNLNITKLQEITQKSVIWGQ